MSNQAKTLKLNSGCVIRSSESGRVAFTVCRSWTRGGGGCDCGSVLKISRIIFGILATADAGVMTGRSVHVILPNKHKMFLQSPESELKISSCQIPDGIFELELNGVDPLSALRPES